MSSGKSWPFCLDHNVFTLRVLSMAITLSNDTDIPVTESSMAAANPVLTTLIMPFNFLFIIKNYENFHPDKLTYSKWLSTRVSTHSVLKNLWNKINDNATTYL